MMSPKVSEGLMYSRKAYERVFSYVAQPPSWFWYERITFTASCKRSALTGAPTSLPSISASASAALSPSEEQSEIGQPWSCVENGQAPLEMWR